MEWTLMLLSVAVALAGWMLARSWYGTDPEWRKAKAFAAAFPRLYKTVFNKYYVDEIYAATFVAAFKGACAFCYKIVDSILIEGLIDLTGFSVQLFGNIIRFLHTGNLRNYALQILLGVSVLIWIIFYF
jgi:NADH-quinone oxidoreductase subunit L